jgi:hypothetical protein
MARRWMLRSIALALLALAAQPEGAGALTITGAQLVPAPTQVKRDALENGSGILVFAEKQNFVLTKELKLGKSGTIAAGTAVDVYYVSYDPETLKKFTAKVGFGVEILGYARTTAQLKKTDFLGNPGTQYASYLYRGIEMGAGTSNRDRLTLSADRKELNFDVRTSNPGDVVRVIIPHQPVPEPGTLLLLSAGLGGLAAASRPRRAA